MGFICCSTATFGYSLSAWLWIIQYATYFLQHMWMDQDILLHGEQAQGRDLFFEKNWELTGWSGPSGLRQSFVDTYWEFLTCKLCQTQLHNLVSTTICRRPPGSPCTWWADNLHIMSVVVVNLEDILISTSWQSALRGLWPTSGNFRTLS